MSFPSSPTNGQQATVNNTTYVYNSAQNTWSVVATTPNFSNLSVSGNITSGNLSTTNSAVANAYYSNYYLYSNGSPITTPAGGSNTMIQFNNAGSFGGATFLQYNLTSGNLVSNSTTAATSTTTGALVVSGGVGVGGNLFVGGNLSIAGNTTFVNTQTITTTDTIAAPTINAGTIGNTGATLTGTLSTAAQPNITSLGNLSSLSMSGVLQVTVAGNTNPTFIDILNSNAATGNRAGLRVRTNSGWATTFYTEQDNYWHAFGDTAGVLRWGFDGTNLKPAANVSYNLGNSSLWWNTVYASSFQGTSTTAKYADLAEMYHADDYYAPGTVMIFGGDLDVTVSTQSHDTAVAGVVSTNPAYLMNDNFESDNWLPIALTGRVPCLVRGPVAKGTLLVSSDQKGVACAMDKSLYEPGCIIGKSMDIISDNSIKKIEIAVGRF